MDVRDATQSTAEGNVSSHITTSHAIRETPFGSPEELDIDQDTPLQPQEACQQVPNDSSINWSNPITDNCSIPSTEQRHKSENSVSFDEEEEPKREREILKSDAPLPVDSVVAIQSIALDGDDSNEATDAVSKPDNHTTLVQEEHIRITPQAVPISTEESTSLDQEQTECVSNEAEKPSAESSNNNVQTANSVTVPAQPSQQDHSTEPLEPQDVPTQSPLPLTATLQSTTQPTFPSSPTKFFPSSPLKQPSSPPKPAPQNPTLTTLTDRKNTLLQSFTAHPNLATYLPKSTDPAIMDEASALAAATAITQRHIKLLHSYNEIRDVGMGLMGLIAEARGVRVRDVQEEFGIEPKD